MLKKEGNNLKTNQMYIYYYIIFKLVLVLYYKLINISISFNKLNCIKLINNNIFIKVKLYFINKYTR